MTPGKLNKKWQKRLEDTDEESIAHKLITEFLIDIEWLHVEPTKEEIETRELLSRIVDRMRENGEIIDLSDEEK